MITRTQYNRQNIEIEWSGSKYHPARNYLANGDPGYPEEGGFEGVDHVWAACRDKNDNLVIVDVSAFIENEILETMIVNELTEDEKEYYHL